MLRGISKTEQIQHISKFDSAQSEEAGATVFLLGALDARQRAYILDLQVSYSVTQADGNTAANVTSLIRAGTRNVEAVRLGLRGWRNFPDENNNQIEYHSANCIVQGVKYDGCSDQTLNALPPDILTELAEQILKINQISGEQAKN